MKPEANPTPDNGDDVPKNVLNKRFIEAKTRLADDQARGVRTREKANRLMLAKAREEEIDKELVVKAATFLFVALRQKMISASPSYPRKLQGCKDPPSRISALTELQTCLL